MADSNDWPQNSQPIDTSDGDGGEPDEATYYVTGVADNQDSGLQIVYDADTGEYTTSDVPAPA